MLLGAYRFLILPPQGQHQRRIGIRCGSGLAHVSLKGAKDIIRKNGLGHKRLHQSLESRLPCFPVWLNPSFVPTIDVRMGHFMHIRDQKSVRIQICVNGNLCFPVGESAKITQP